MVGGREVGHILSPFSSVILELYGENLPLSNRNLSYSKGIMRGKSRAEEEREVVVPPFIFPSAGRNRSYRHYIIWLVPDVCFPVTLPTHSCPLHSILSPLQLLPDNVVRWSPDKWRETERMDMRDIRPESVYSRGYKAPISRSGLIWKQQPLFRLGEANILTVLPKSGWSDISIDCKEIFLSVFT